MDFPINRIHSPMHYPQLLAPITTKQKNRLHDRFPHPKHPNIAFVCMTQLHRPLAPSRYTGSIIDPTDHDDHAPLSTLQTRAAIMLPASTRLATLRTLNPQIKIYTLYISAYWRRCHAVPEFPPGPHRLLQASEMC